MKFDSIFLPLPLCHLAARSLETVAKPAGCWRLEIGDWREETGAECILVKYLVAVSLECWKVDLLKASYFAQSEFLNKNVFSKKFAKCAIKTGKFF